MHNREQNWNEKHLLNMKVVGNRTRWTEDVARVEKTNCQHEHRKQKIEANDEEADTNTDGTTT